MKEQETPPIEVQFADHRESETEQFESDRAYFHKYFSSVVNEQLTLFEGEDGEVRR